MRYMMLIHHDEAALAKALAEGTLGRLRRLQRGAGQGGSRHRGRRAPAAGSAATTVAPADGKTDVLDGPYADTKEQLAGYFLVDVADLDEAIAWAKRCPSSSIRLDRDPAAVHVPGRARRWSRDMPSEAAAAGRAAERVARESYGRLVAFLAARTRDVAGAEDALAEAFAAALRMWPTDGVPDNPDAWLLTVARRRQTDAVRRRQTRSAGEEHLKLMADEIEAAAEERRRDPRSPPRADVRLRPSGHRARHARAADPADHPRPHGRSTSPPPS